MTRKQKHMTVLDWAEDFLVGDGDRNRAEIVEAIRYVRGRGECPTWWAEAVFELRAVLREDREEAPA